MNRSIYHEFSILKDAQNIKTNKKAIRSTVKQAINLHSDNYLSDDDLRAILELAMAWEISINLERKMKDIGEII